MKHPLLTAIAAVLLAGCGEAQPPEPPKSKAPDISIHDAADSGNIEVVKQHLAAGTDVNAKDDSFGGTPLHYAAMEGHMEIVELLITKGADVNAKDDGGATPLDWAKEMNERHSPEAKVAKKEVATILHRKHGGKTGEELKAEGK